MEPLECRTLLDAGGILQGTAFFDNNGDKVLDPSDTLKAGATIELYKQAGNAFSLVDSTTTGPDGRYLFSGLAAGTYQIVEAPGLHYGSVDVEMHSQVYPAARVNSNTIQVTVLEPMQIALDEKVFFDRNKWTYIQYEVFGTVHQSTLGQFPLQLSGTDGSGNTVTTSFFGTCWDPYHTLVYRYNDYMVEPSPVPVGPGMGNGGQIAYLHNHYAADPVTGASVDLPTLNAVALELAIRELEFDAKATPYTAADFFNGNFKVDKLLSPLPPGPQPSLNDFVNQAVIYANDAQGKNETAMFLVVTEVLRGGSQGMLATEAFNFANYVPTSVHGYKFNDLNGNGVDDNEPRLAGWTIALSGTASATTTTGPDGEYSFTGLAPGTYTVSEVNQTGWTQTAGGTTITLTDGQEAVAYEGEAGQLLPLQSEVPIAGLAFGNFEQTSIHGYKFNDLNGNGLDDNDPRLAGWTIAISGPVSATTTTGLNGEYSFTGLVPGTYTVTEVNQTGWTKSAGGATFTLTSGQEAVAYEGEAGQLLPLQSEVPTAGLAFGNFEQTSIHGYKFNDLNGNGVDDNEPRLAGWTIELSGKLSASTTTGPNGEYSFTGLVPGTYTVSEVNQTGWTKKSGGATFTLTSGQEAVAYRGEAGQLLPLQTEVPTAGLAFGNHHGNIIVIGMDKSPTTPQEVDVVDADTGKVLSKFVPYEDDFTGGIRVATGDLDGDGLDEIITAPGRGRAPEIRVFTQFGVELTAYRTMAYDPAFVGGVQVAVGDVNGDGKNDIITIPTSGPAEVKAFLNQSPNVDPILDVPYQDFLAFPATFISGGVVAVADMGQLVGGTFVNTLDGKAEIVVGSGAGMPSSVEVFDVSGAPTLVQSFVPIDAAFQGGLSLSVARITPDLIPDIVVGAGVGGGSAVEVWGWDTPSATLVSLGGFTAFSGPSVNAPVHVAAQDADGDKIADTIFAAQGPDGTADEIHAFHIVSTSPLQVQQTPPIAGFPGPWFIAPLANCNSPESFPGVPLRISSTMVAEYPTARNGVLDSADSLVLTWLVTGAEGGTSESLWIDGQPVSVIPDPTAGGASLAAARAVGAQGEVSYSLAGLFGPLAAGNHTFALKSTDAKGNAASYSGSFQVKAAVPTKAIMDNSSPGYAETGAGWAKVTPGGVLGNYRVHNAGTGANTAAWNFGNLANGTYEVWGTWTPNSARASDASFSISTGSASPVAVRVNQRKAPSGLTDSNAKWQKLATVTVTNGKLTVTLSDATKTGSVAADAVMLRPVAPQLTRVAIGGPAKVNENTTARFTLTAYYSDGTSKDVTSAATWSENSKYATVDRNGKLTASAVGSNQVCQLSAAFGGKTVKQRVDIVNLPASPLLAAGGAVAGNVAALTAADLAPIVRAAETRWANAGLTPQQVKRLLQTQVVLTDLPGAYLGMATADTIYIDLNAAGYGWFVDATPNQDEEFAVGAGGSLRAVDPRAVDRMDLLTVVSHELGHILGLAHSNQSELMQPTLSSGIRRPAGDETALAASILTSTGQTDRLRNSRAVDAFFASVGRPV